MYSDSCCTGGCIRKIQKKKNHHENMLPCAIRKILNFFFFRWYHENHNFSCTFLNVRLLFVKLFWCSIFAQPKIFMCDYKTLQHRNMRSYCPSNINRRCFSIQIWKIFLSNGPFLEERKIFINNPYYYNYPEHWLSIASTRSIGLPYIFIKYS